MSCRMFKSDLIVEQLHSQNKKPITTILLKIASLAKLVSKLPEVYNIKFD